MRVGFTGFVGNGPRAIVEDSVLREAKQYNISRSVIGEGFWAGTLSLEPFDGYGIVGAIEDTTNGATWIHHDRLTTDVLVKHLALSDKSRLSFASLINTDYVAHDHGVRSQEFQSAIKSLAHFLESILNAAAKDTVIIIAADHGHIPPGGHGGPETIVMQIPLVIYSKDTKLKSKQLGSDVNKIPHITDLSATISALLSIPPPAQSEGLIVDTALPLLTEKEFIAHFAKKVGKETYLESQLVLQSDTPFLEGFNDPDAIIFYQMQTKTLIQKFGELESWDMWGRIVTNSIVTVIGCATLLCLFAFCLYRWTYLDFFSIVMCKSANGFVNRSACALAVAMFISFWGLSLASFIIFVRLLVPYGNWSWSFSILCSYERAYKVFGKSYLLHQIVTRSGAGFIFGVGRGRVPGLFYLFRCYCALLCLIQFMIFIILYSVDHIAYPGVRWIPYYLPKLWNMQFRVDCCSVMLIPFAAVITASLFICEDSCQSVTALQKMGTQRATLLPRKWQQNTPCTTSFRRHVWGFLERAHRGVRKVLCSWAIEGNTTNTLACHHYALHDMDHAQEIEMHFLDADSGDDSSGFTMQPLDGFLPLASAV
ncbi:hypothetical protein Pelo_11532 [Pelomyxa schiedti]|nr:hypothetical protein Pelo_11532 [Pelomyxa schiedti]